MRSKQLIFILVTSLLFTACDAGKYYARKKIDRHYEEMSENKTMAAPEWKNEKAPVSTEKMTTQVLEQDGPKENNGPAASAIPSAPVKTTKTILPVIHKNNGSSEEQNISSVQTPVQKKEIKKVTGEKTVGKGLLMILVALLLLLLGVLFVAALGDLGLVFGIIFYIGAVVLFVAGIIVMFMNN